MRNPIVLCVLGCTLLLLFGCRCTFSKNDVPTNLIELSDDLPVVQVKNWRITEAFFGDSAVAGKLVDVNFLSGVRESESDVTPRNLTDRNFNSRAIKSTDAGIPIDRLFGKEANAAVYLYCELESRTAQDVRILFSGIQESKIWMNNQFVYQSRWRSVQSKHYQEYVPVGLKRGKNFLLVKVALSDRVTAGIRWNFNMFVGTKKYAQESFLKDYRFTILDEPVTKDSARLYLGPYANDDVFVKVADMSNHDAIPWTKRTKGNDREAQSGLRAISLAGIDRECLYRISVRMGKDTLAQDFIFGDYANVVTQLKGKYRKETHGFAPNEDFTTAYERLDYLKTKHNLPSSQVSEKSHWDLSRVLFAKEVWTYLESVPEHSGDRHFSGIISGYVSAIDSSRQYYLAHIPESLLKKGGKVPLIFIMPFTFTYSPRRLLETWGVSNLDQMWWDAKLAEDVGFGVVWADLRGHPGINEISVTAFQEILASLSARFELDKDRLFVMGNSASSTKAMSLATRLPSVFAGAIFINPEVDALRRSKTYANMANLRNQRVFIQHSSKDEIVPIHKAEEFYGDLKNNGIDAHFVKVDNSTHFVAPKDTYKQVFSLLKNIRKKESNRYGFISGSELKYADNGAIRVMEKLDGGRFKIAVARRNDTVVIEQRNVKKFEIDFSQFGHPTSLPHVRLNNDGFSLDKKTGNVNTFVFNLDEKLHFRKNNLTEGPINHVFAGAFKVVYNGSGKNIKDLLDEQWKNMYSSPIPSVKEEAFRKETYEDNHLVIIGSKWKNARLKQILNGLPIKLERDSLAFRGKKYGRKNLTASFVYPNPLNPEKYVCFIETDKAVKDLFLRDFTNACPYDYELYNTAQDAPMPIEIGNFDNLWK